MVTVPYARTQAHWEPSLPLEKDLQPQSYNQGSFRPGPLNPASLKQLGYVKRERLDFNRFCRVTLVVESM